MARTYDRIRLGVSSLVWAADLSEQGPFESFLDEAAEIGYEGILVFDMTVTPWLDRPAEFKALLERRGLDFAGVILRPNIEFKDYSPQTDLNTEVGRGLADWPAIADAVREIGYKGWIVIEQNSSFRPGKIGAAESFHYVRDVLGLGRR